MSESSIEEKGKAGLEREAEEQRDCGLGAHVLEWNPVTTATARAWINHFTPKLRNYILPTS